MLLADLNFLLVDDSSTVRKLTANIIETLIGSKQIYQASNGMEAIDILKSNKIDFIISDWNMPNLSGDELLYEVRNNEEWKDIPFILMTTNAGRDFLVTAIQLGVTQYILKPFSPGELEDKIRKSWAGSNKRSSMRYFSLPEHRLIIKGEKESYLSEIINICRTGMLLRVKYSRSITLFTNYEMYIEFKKCEGLNFQNIGPIIGMVIRIETEDFFHPTSSICFLATYFSPGLTDKDTEVKLKLFLKYLNSRCADTIPDE